jgi:MFS transporter, CP family, cyanate transporter
LKDKNSYRFVILSIVILTRGCIGLIQASAGPLIPFIKNEFGLNQGAAGWFASIVPLTMAILAVPVGIIGIRYSLKKTFAVGAALLTAGIFAPFIQSYLPLLLTRACFAIGCAIVASIGSAIMAEWASGRELPVINGITMSFFCFIVSIAFLATVPIAVVLSWRAPIVIYACLAVACAIAWIIFGKNKNKAKTGREARAEVEARPELSIRQLLTQRSTILLALAVMGAWCLGNAVGAWLPTYYHEVFKMPLQTASSLTAINTGIGIGVCILAGILPQRLGRRKPFLIIPGVFMGLSAVCALLFNNMAVIIITVILFGIFSNLMNPSLYTIPFELPNASPRSGAVIMFAIQCGGNFGGFMGPLITGYLADLTGSYLPGFLICAVLSLSAVAASLLLPETGPAGRKVTLKVEAEKAV